MIESTLLCYKLYVIVLKDLGFHLNTYDMYVVNKYINGKQCTIYWCVDDNKVSPGENVILNDIINRVEGIFQVLTSSKGNAHTFLVMKKRYLKNKRVSINMNEYISGAVQDFGEDFLQMVMSPEARWMFTVGKVREIKGRMLYILHSVVMKLLCILHRVQPY